MKYFFTTALLILLLGVGCTSQQGTSVNQIAVSIEPLRYITEQITGQDFVIETLVPAGASPETYEPTPTQMRSVANSAAYINIGLLDFERNLIRGIEENMPQVRSISLADGVELIGEASCESANHQAGHHHGEDPHIWTSPRTLKQMAKTLYQNIATLYPDSAKNGRKYEQFIARLDTLDQQLNQLFAGRSVSFMIYHPALSYLARDYGLEQIPLEYEGKEPSVEYVQHLIETAREKQIKRLFYQQQFSQNTVQTLARELGIETTPMDPLATNVEENLLQISSLIANQ